MTIHEASQQLRFQLFGLYDDREAGNITDLVMEHITGWKRIDRVVNKKAILSIPQQARLEAFTRKLLQHTPLQYVLHEAWFYRMKLYVDEHVLIPRPETEELADWIIKDNIKKSTTTLRILDIGTGSGCIPLAIKKNLISAEVHACDISVDALAVATKNAQSEKLALHFHQLDILLPAERDALPVFDIIVSNPPYIPQSDKTGMATNVLAHEPHLALFVDNNNPLIFYEAIAGFAQGHLAPGGAIYLEIHEALGAAVQQLFSEKKFASIELKKDMQGKDRMVKVGCLN